MRKEREQSLPEARKKGLIVQQLADEVLVYDQQRHKAHCLNNTAALVWERCDGKTSVAKITEKLSKHAGSQVGEDVVMLAIAQLAKVRLLEESAGQWKAREGMSRREMMKRAGLAAAIALPVVTSIVAPNATQAATCLPTGSACTTSTQCCVPICNAGRCA